MGGVRETVRNVLVNHRMQLIANGVRDAVVVITGASTGIGRATAVELARRGATVLLVGRRPAPLLGLAERCDRLGGRAVPLPADVTDEPAIQAVAHRAMTEFGKLDAWVNNAALSAFARFEETPPEIFRRVVETNLFGYVHGARAALRCFRQHGRGVLVNVSSVVGPLPGAVGRRSGLTLRPTRPAGSDWSHCCRGARPGTCRSSGGRRSRRRWCRTGRRPART
jgi:NAD(P)-dependent dehydrogenase (short-subunit alcohol dehydrogenase family)